MAAVAGESSWTALFPPVVAQHPRAVLIAWALMALLNLAAGVVVASWPERQQDLDTMRRWGHEWLAQGRNVYAIADEAPDYPPHAIVVLSPLAEASRPLAVRIWAAVNVALAILAPLLAVRIAKPRATWSDAAVATLVFLCWGGVRTLLQFSLLALVLGLLAMVLADTRPVWAGVCLGVASIKPQVAIPFVLWALLTRRARLLGVAFGSVLGSFFLFCVRAHASPFDVMAHYLAVIKELYLGDARMIGLADLRQLVALTMWRGWLVDGVSAAIATMLLCVVGVVGLQEAQRRRAVAYGAPALAGIWSVLTFYHLTYGFILLLPTAMLLIFSTDSRPPLLRHATFWVLQLGLMVDVPGLWRRLGGRLDAPILVSAVAPHFDRLLLTIVFAAVVALYVRSDWSNPHPSAAETPAPPAAAIRSGSAMI
jgi:Glycosyltransferase family 87